MDVRAGGVESLDGAGHGDGAVELTEEDVAVHELALRLLEVGLEPRGLAEGIARAAQAPRAPVGEPEPHPRLRALRRRGRGAAVAPDGGFDASGLEVAVPQVEVDARALDALALEPAEHPPRRGEVVLLEALDGLAQAVLGVVPHRRASPPRGV